MPELNGVAVGIREPGEPAVRVSLRVDLDYDAPSSELAHHGVEVADPEVDHPLLIGATEHLGILTEDGPHGWSCLLFPDRIVVTARWQIDAKVFGVPSPEPVRGGAT